MVKYFKMHVLLLFIVTVSFGTSAIKFSIIGFPDSLNCELDSIAFVEIMNNSDKPIHLKESKNPIDVAIKDSTGSLVSIAFYNSNKEMALFVIQPKKSKKIGVQLSGYYYKDSTIDLNDLKKTDNSMEKLINNILKDFPAYIDTSVIIADVSFHNSAANETLGLIHPLANNPDYVLYKMDAVRQVKIKKFLPTGKYNYRVYINIAELENSAKYHVVSRDVYISCSNKNVK